MDKEEQKVQSLPAMQEPEIPQKPGVKKKKWIIIACIIIIILFLPLIMTSLLRTRDNNDIQTALSPTVSQDAKNAVTQQPPVSVPNIQKWIKYEAKSFTLEHAPDWFLQTGTVAGGGELVIVKPQALPQDYIYPKILIQTEPFSEKRTEERKAIFAGLGLKESLIKIDGITATKFSGTIPFKTVAGKRVNEPIQETEILLSKGETTYLFQYEYEGNKINSELEKYFTDFIKGIRLK